MVKFKRDNPLISAISEEQKKPNPGITNETMYEQLVPVKSTTAADNPGIKALKTFHLKTPNAYESQVTDRIFTIG